MEDTADTGTGSGRTLLPAAFAGHGVGIHIPAGCTKSERAAAAAREVHILLQAERRIRPDHIRRVRIRAGCTRSSPDTGRAQDKGTTGAAADTMSPESAGCGTAVDTAARTVPSHTPHSLPAGCMNSPAARIPAVDAAVRVVRTGLPVDSDLMSACAVAAVHAVDPGDRAVVASHSPDAD